MPKTIILAASLPAAPQKLYDMYLEAKAHAAFTGHAVTIAPRAGAKFSAFGGMIWGTILHVEPKRQIVQTWRSAHFSKRAIDSVLILSFWPEKGGGRIELVHVNVDDSDFAGVSDGWQKHYWMPWRAYLEKGAAARKARSK